MATALLLDPVYLQHLPGIGHPESPARYLAITHAVEQSGLANKLVRLRSRPASEEEIARCHTREYIATVKRDFSRGATELSTGDTQIGPQSFDVALKAVGGVLECVDAVMNEKVKNAFAAVRPPGHHATPARGMGFCVFNNIAAGARHAQKAHGAKRVLIADWDVHHGNGTQDVFYSDDSVFFFSTHQAPWYPGTGAREETGEGQGKGTTMNRPLPAGSRAEILDAFRLDLAEAAEKFRPDLVMISAGFDSRAGDPLGQFRLTDDDFAELTRCMLDIAERFANGRLVSVLEGGYALDGLAKGVTSHLATLQTA